MTWNWQKTGWPNFSWDKARLAKAEEQFLLETGVMVGAVKHLGQEDREQLTVEALSTEALTTSEIEGEILDLASVRSSIRKELGLTADKRRVRPAAAARASARPD
jgi:Fic family protein